MDDAVKTLLPRHLLLLLLPLLLLFLLLLLRLLLLLLLEQRGRHSQPDLEPPIGGLGSRALGHVTVPPWHAH